jgi:hypothetical protein
MIRHLAGKRTGQVIRSDEVIVSSTGGASIKIAGDNIDLNAKGTICIHAGKTMHISSAEGTIYIQGGKLVVINEHEKGPAVIIDQAIPAQPAAAPGKGLLTDAAKLPQGVLSKLTNPGGIPEVGQLADAGMNMAKSLMGQNGHSSPPANHPTDHLPPAIKPPNDRGGTSNIG